jgi:hypothetical protein
VKTTFKTVSLLISLFVFLLFFSVILHLFLSFFYHFSRLWYILLAEINRKICYHREKHLHHRVQTGSGVHPASYPMGTRGSFPGGKAAEVWSWPHTSAYCRDQKNAWSYTSTPQYAFMAWCSVKSTGRHPPVCINVRSVTKRDINRNPSPLPKKGPYL